MKKTNLIALAAGLMMMLLMTGCSSTFTEEENAWPENEITETSGTETQDSGNLQMVNPFTEYHTIGEAEAAAGFEITLPMMQNSCKEVYLVIEDEMIEALYERDGETVYSIRKGIGTEDVSGDYTDYPEAAEVTVNECNVTMKGENGTISLAVWTDGNYSYAVSTNGLSEEDIENLVSQIG